MHAIRKEANKTPFFTNRLGEDFFYYNNYNVLMFSPKIKSIAHKILIHLFAPDFRQIYRRIIEVRSAQHRIAHLLRTVTPADLQEARLCHIADRMEELQRLLYLLTAKGVTRHANLRKLNTSLNRIHTQLDLIEKELLRLTRYTRQ